MGIPPNPLPMPPLTIYGFLLASSLDESEDDAWWSFEPEESDESWSWWPVTTENVFVFVVERRGPVLETAVEAGGSVASVRLTMRVRGMILRIWVSMAVNLQGVRQ